MPRTVAFFSYTRRDDRASGGLLSAIRVELERRVSAGLGHDIEIFQDVDDIIGGEDWRARLDKALAEAAYLIPVITPSFFNSEPCRDELARFLEKGSGRVLPIHFIETPLILDEAAAAHDTLTKAVERTQWIDFRDHDHKTEIDMELRRTISNFAKTLTTKLYVELQTAENNRRMIKRAEKIAADIFSKQASRLKYFTWDKKPFFDRPRQEMKDFIFCREEIASLEFSDAVEKAEMPNAHPKLHVVRLNDGFGDKPRFSLIREQIRVGQRLIRGDHLCSIRHTPFSVEYRVNAPFSCTVLALPDWWEDSDFPAFDSKLPIAIVFREN